MFGHLSTDEGRIARARLEQEGFYHIPRLQPADPHPGEDVTIGVRTGAQVTITVAALYYTVDGTDPVPGADNTSRVAMRRTCTEWDTLTWSFSEEWEAVIPGQVNDTEVRYIIEGTTPSDDHIRCPYMPPSPKVVTAADQAALRKIWETRARFVAPRVYAYVVDEEQVPTWLQDAVIYQIFVDRFAPDPGTDFAQPPDRSGFFGGTLAGIHDKLDYLADLGVTCLWLTPIFPTPSHHGYDATDYCAVEPRLGDLDEFERLTAEAHDRGIRVVLDFVANHVSNEHPAFVSAQQKRDADTASWFRFHDWPDDYDTFLGVRSMPRLVTDEPSVRAYLIESACSWLEHGADGFRLDHAHGASHAFWSVFRRATRQAKPESVTFGEVTDTPAYTRSFAGRMDGVLDFGLLETLRKYFVFNAISATEFDRVLHRHFQYFGCELTLPSFLDNHDMNRFLFSADGDVRRLKLAALCQFTLPGPPIVYYGSELGLSQLRPADPLEESRLPMLWGDEQNEELLTYYKQVIALRKAGGDIWRGERSMRLIDDSRELYVYSCGGYVIFLHNGDRAVRVDLTALLHDDATVLLRTCDDVIVDSGRASIALPPYSGCVIH